MTRSLAIISFLTIASVISACGTASSPNTSVPAAATAPNSVAGTPRKVATTAPIATVPAPTATSTPSPVATRTPPVLGGATPSPLAVGSAAPAPAGGARFNPATTTIRLETVAGGLRAPTDVKPAGDGSGRLFVVEKAGTVRIVRDGIVSPAPFLDITPLVRSDDSERGLLGIAFHPKYRANGLFFVYYTEQTGDIIVARYSVSADANRADPASALELLHIQHRGAANHNGGDMLFGPDGFLYIGTGDGGASGDRFGNSQNPGALLAKLLRIDVDAGKPYGIPANNPFVNRAGFRPEIWAWGLRNPWRFSFDRTTGDLYIADVGQDLWEEVDFQAAGSKGGEDYGWNKMEGTHCYPPGASCSPAAFVTPVAEYDHSNGDCSIIGGYVYHGAAQPALSGAYLFADYCTGHFRALQPGADGRWSVSDLLTIHVPVSSFGEDENGEVYVLGYGSGELYHVVSVAR